MGGMDGWMGGWVPRCFYLFFFFVSSSRFFVVYRPYFDRSPNNRSRSQSESWPDSDRFGLSLRNLQIYDILPHTHYLGREIHIHRYDMDTQVCVLPKLNGGRILERRIYICIDVPKYIHILQPNTYCSLDCLIGNT